MYRCAIIGCGNIAGGYDRGIPNKWSFTHAGAYHLCDETKLVTASDLDPKALSRFGEKWQITKLYKDYCEMLANENIDILSLCLPTENHFEAFKSAADKNLLAIFCEKPLAYDLNEAREMVRMSKGKIVSINYFRRWNPSLSKLRNELNHGIYGRVKKIIARYTKGIFMNGSHLVDLILWFFGEPSNIHHIKTANPDHRDPGVDFTLSFKDDIIAYFINVQGEEYVFADVDILTEKGRIVLAQRGQTIENFDLVSEPYNRQFFILERTNVLETNWRYCLVSAVQEIVNCLNNDGQISCTPEDSLRVLEICHEVVQNKV